MGTSLENKGSTTRLTPLKAIKAHCIDCSGGVRKVVVECCIPHCPLYPYRLGKNPARSGGNYKGNGEALKRYREEKQ